MINGSCNLRCKYCYISAGGNSLPDADFNDISDRVNILNSINVQSVIIGGGEPLLHDNIFEILEMSSEKIKTHLLTNGTLIDVNIAQKLVKSGINSLSISLDSVTPTIHNELRDGSFVSVVNGIKYCVNEGLDVNVSSCITQKNFDQTQDLIKFAEDIGLRSITFEGLNPVGYGKSCGNLLLTVDDTEWFLKNLNRYLNELKPNVDVLMFYPQWVRWDSNATGCGVGKDFFGIDPEGNFMPCTNLPLTLGNIHKTEFEEFWNCEMMNKLREKRRGGCDICEFKDQCGGCRSKAYANGDIFGSDPSCKLAFKGVCNGKDNIKKYWDYKSKSYKGIVGDTLDKERILWKKIEIFNKCKCLKILDIGTGNGFVALILAEMGHEVTALDISPKMLNIAMENSLKNNLSINFHRSDAEKLPFSDKYFDVVISRYTLWTILNPFNTLKEWKRVLRKGGSVIVMEKEWKEQEIKNLLNNEDYETFQKYYGPLKNKLPLYSPKKEDVLTLFNKIGYENTAIKSTSISSENKNVPDNNFLIIATK
jgi:radical SAM protein with 4Fe4S-binding SPASM domain